jgi:hypothetical protein
MKLSCGQIFGEETFLVGLPAMFSVKCVSIVGEVFMINEVEFVRRLKASDMTMKALELNLG